MELDTEDKLPREYYEAVVIIKTEMEDRGVPEEIVEETMDDIESLIIAAMRYSEETGDEVEVETA
jgi:flagellar biosynthesis/type III secretory pathway M-ring protein FliF/YscJ